MLLGIISDTHGYFHPNIPKYLADVDLILHAGDVGTPDVLEALQDIAPTTAVWGNVDGNSVRSRTRKHVRTEIDGLDIWMTHIAGPPGRWVPDIRNDLLTDPPDLLICGHSHILRIKRVKEPPGMLYINPGAAGREGFHQVKTCLRLETNGGSIRQAEVIHLDEPGT